MPRRGKSVGSSATGFQAASLINLSDSTAATRLSSTSSESATTEIIVGPNKGEIARIAYQLWQNNGCPVGFDQSDWFRAEAMLRNGLAASGEDASKCVAITGGRTRNDYDMGTVFEWVGHWEIWESEWAGAHWVADKAAGLRL